MEKIQKVIVVLLVVAIVFSVVSTLINFSMLDFEFKPVVKNVKVPSSLPKGDPTGNLNLVVDSISPPGG